MAMENEKEPMQCGNQSHNVEVAQGRVSSMHSVPNGAKVSK